MQTFLLDTSAIMALYQDEAGADAVEALLHKAKRKQIRLLLSFMSFMEVFYVSWRKEGKVLAHRTYLDLKMLPLERIEVTEPILLRAGELKATYPISLADSWIAATAEEYDATLLHKDPEFEALTDRISLQQLPYK